MLPETVYVYRASSYHRTLTFVFDSDPGLKTVEDMLRQQEGANIHIADRFPLIGDVNVCRLLKQGDGTISLIDELTTTSGKVIPPGTPIKFNTMQDILWSPGDDNDGVIYN